LNPVWIKLVVKHREGIFPLCQGKGEEVEENQAEKSLMGVGLLSSSCGEIQALHCPGETRTLRVSPKAKLISNSQVCPMRGRGW
jgi:hypothetical protein